MATARTSGIPKDSIATVFALARDIKLAHSVFAMPFAVLAVFLARDRAESWGSLAGKLALVVLCMVSARTWAMLVNRLADRSFDAANPRTAGRALPSGRASPGAARAAAGGAGAAFVALAVAFGPLFQNWLPALLALPALGWIALYSFTKRFTVLCHLFLGGALAASPVAAAIAVGPHALGDMPALWLIAGMVLCWVAGFDIIYALQDINADRSLGLHSIPARLGPRRAAYLSRGLHGVSVALLIGACMIEPRLGSWFASGVGLAAGLLVAEHVVLARQGLRGLSMAFFTLNGVVSCVLCATGVVDLL